MKARNYFLTLLAGLVVAMGCLKFEESRRKVPINSRGEYAILFSNYGGTKATMTSVSQTGYDEFALFAWNSINDTIMNPYVVVADNVNSYVYDGVSSQTLQYFKNVADYYDFIGVIPDNHEMSLSSGNVVVKNVTSFVIDDNKVKQTINLTDTLR